MLAVIALLVFSQQPTELQKQIIALQKEIAETKVLVKQLKSDKDMEREVARQEERAARLAEKRNRQAGRIRDETAEVREANRVLNAKLRAQLIAEKQAKERIESPEIRIAREIEFKRLLALPTPSPEEKTIIALALERNAALEKIRRQNNRRSCRWFRIGCIGRK